MKNIQTGNTIQHIKIGHNLTSVMAYHEIISEKDCIWIFSSMDASGDYFAVLKQYDEAIATVKGEACINDALSNLEQLLEEMRKTGDDRSILKMFYCPQSLDFYQVIQ